jgi:hypothetical protein
MVGCGAAAALTMGLPATIVRAAPAASAAAAPDGPGALSHFDLARKDCVGTARNTGSKVWFTVADGVLSDVYEPTIEITEGTAVIGMDTAGNEGNNQQTEVTTVSNDVCSPSCVDIVASQLLPSVDPVQTGHDLTFNFTVVNVGDTAADFGTPDTPADPKVNPLLWFDVVSDGTFTVLSRTSSNPAVSCVDDVPAGPGSLFSDCAIDHNGATAGGTKLNPGEGVTISIKVHVTGGTVISANGKADPLNIVVGEFLETNNNLVRTVTIVP